MNNRWPLLLLAPFACACSGANAQLVNEPPDDAGASVSNVGPSGASQSTEPSGGGDDSSTGGGSSGGGAGSSSGGGTPASPVNGLDAGTAPVQCPPGGTEQTSGSGDSRADATPFDTVACGTLAPSQTYFWTFELPASASKFGLSFSGGVQIQLMLDGTTVDVEQGAILPFRTKDPYYLRITSLGGSQPESYVVVVIEK
jgi:hypothetical protein